MTREEKLKHQFIRQRKLYELDKEKKWITNRPYGEFWWMYYQLGQNPLFMHLTMFTSTIETMASDE